MQQVASHVMKWEFNTPIIYLFESDSLPIPVKRLYIPLFRKYPHIIEVE